MLTKEDIEKQAWIGDQRAAVVELLDDNALLRKILWLRHDPEHFFTLYGDDGEMQCGVCLIDFKRMSAADIGARFVDLAKIKFFKEKEA